MLKLMIKSEFDDLFKELIIFEVSYFRFILKER